jgi:hypothetical protein
MIRGILIVAALAVAVPLATASASSASAFDLSNQGAAGVPQIAVAPDGTATTAWVINTDSGQSVQARRISPDGTLGPILDLSQAVRGGCDPSTVGQSSSAPRVAVGDDGTAVVVWQRADITFVQTDPSDPSTCQPAGSTNHATMRRIAPDGTLSPAPVDLSADGGNAFNPDVAISANGSAVATWTRFDGTDPSFSCCSIVQAVRIASDGNLGSTLDLSDPGQNADAQRVAVADDGSATVAWRRQNSSSIYIAQAAHIAPNDSKTSLGDLSDPGQGAQTPVVAMQGDGVAEILWQRFAGNNLRIQARHVAANQTVGSLTNLSADGGDASNPEVVTNPQGGFGATWQRLQGEDSIVQSAPIDSSGGLGSVIDLSSASVGGADPGLAFAPSGDALVTWQTGSTTPRIQSRTIPTTGSPGPVQNLTGSGTSSTPAVALDAGGNSTVVWTQATGGGTPIARGTRIASGTTIAPVADLTPSSKTYGFVQPGQTSDWQTITVANTGTGAMSIGDVTLDGANPDEFETQNDTCSNTWVLEGASCTVDARFAPQDTGDPSVDLGDKAATLTVADDASGNPHSVALSGTAGTQPTPPPPTPTTPTTPTTTEPESTPGPSGPSSEPPRGEPPFVPPTETPTATLRALANTPRRGGFVLIRLVTNGPGHVSAVATMRPAVHAAAHKRSVYGTAKATARSAGPLRLVLRPNARGRAALQHRRRMRILLTITFRPTDGPAITKHRSLDVRAPHRHRR